MASDSLHRVELECDLARLQEERVHWVQHCQLPGGGYAVPFFVPPHYTNIQWLGAGAQGALVQAVDTSTGMDVAIKMLSCAEHPEHVLRELRTMGHFVRSPNISGALEVYHVEHNGVMWVFIVMPLMKGSLDQWMASFRSWRKSSGRKEAAVPEDTVRMVGYQMLSGLATLHSGGTLHRDLAPKNVLYHPLEPEEDVMPCVGKPDPPDPVKRLLCAVEVTEEDVKLARDALPEVVPDRVPASHVDLQSAVRNALARDGYRIPPFPFTATLPDGPPLRLRASITDFGLSRAIDEDDQRGLTDYVVTRYYRAPELILGYGKGDYSGEKVDVWALGCVLGEMVTKQMKPFLPGRTATEQMEYIFLLLGIPDPQAIAHMCTDKTYAFVEKSKQREAARGRRVGTDFKEFFRNASPDCIAALRRMLVLDPRERATSSELLELEFFKRGQALCGAGGVPCVEERLSTSIEDEIRTAHPDQIRSMIVGEVARQRESRAPS